MKATDLQMRSPIRRALEADGARFAEICGAAVAANYGRDDEHDTLRRAGLIDLSPLPRAGLKGAEALAWARARGLRVPDANNRCEAQDGALVARLSDRELLVLDDPAAPGKQCDALAEACARDKPPRCFHVPRRASHAWFVVAGEHAPELFAKICAVDQRADKFAPGAVAQTVAARVGAIVIRRDAGATPVRHLLCESASADYMWSCLKDAASEYGGAPVGCDALRALLQSST